MLQKGEVKEDRETAGGLTMNQYIITEEERKKMLKLWSVIQQHIDWQHNACHTLDLTVQEAYNLMENVRSHPYQSERDKVLDRLDKEIHIREDEMNRKAGLEENLVTMSGYYASAGALNWVRKVLIDGSRETIRQAGEPDA